MHMTSQAQARGIWDHVAEAPLLVSDPLKARWLMGLGGRPPSKAALERHELGVLPTGYYRVAQKEISAQALRELERLFSGGDVLWRDGFENLVVNEGLNNLLNSTIGGDANDTTWFIGIIGTVGAGSQTYAAADTLGSHAGWAELVTTTDFSLPATNRGAYVRNAASTAMSLSNSSSPVSFTIARTLEIAGSFMAGVNSGVGGGGLYSAGAFTAGDKTLNLNDTLAVTATFTTAAS